MAAKYFLMYNTTLERWKAGSFKPNGDVDVDFTITQGEARDRWQELNGVDLLTLRFVTSNAEIPPFKNIPVTDIASDLEGTIYTSKSDFEIATKDFFFRVGGSGISSDGFLYLPTSISNKGLRWGERDGWAYAIDRVITETGFSGEENTDWENIGGQPIVTN